MSHIFGRYHDIWSSVTMLSDFAADVPQAHIDRYIVDTDKMYELWQTKKQLEKMEMGQNCIVTSSRYFTMIFHETLWAYIS